MNTFFMLKPFPIVFVCCCCCYGTIHLYTFAFKNTQMFSTCMHACMHVLVPNIVSSSLSRSLSNSFNRYGYLKISETIVMHSSSALARSLSLFHQALLQCNHSSKTSSLLYPTECLSCFGYQGL